MLQKNIDKENRKNRKTWVGLKPKKFKTKKDKVLKYEKEQERKQKTETF